MGVVWLTWQVHRLWSVVCDAWGMTTSPAESRPAYATDVTDAQWKLIDPMLPPPNLDGRHEKHPRREIVNAIFYLLRTGCAWRHLPHDLPPWQTVYRYFRRWTDDGTLDRLHDALRDRLRDSDGRDPAASAGIIDAQSVKGADTVATATRGYDAGKRVNGRKRHIVVDTLGLLMVVAVTSASVQDRDGGRAVLDRVRFVMPSLVTVFADGGYAGRLVIHARRRLRIAVELVKKPADQKGFVVLPRRWVVERTFAWLVRCRRLDHDYERLPAISEAMVKWAMIGIMTRRLAPGPGRRPWQANPKPTPL